MLAGALSTTPPPPLEQPRLSRLDRALLPLAVAILLCLASLPVTIGSSSSCTPPVSRCIDCAIVVRAFGDTAAGPSFPAVAVPAAMYAATSGSSSERLSAGRTDAYGVVRLCLPPVDSHSSCCCHCRSAAGAAQSAPNAVVERASTAAAVLLVSVNESPLPARRDDWAAWRVQLHPRDECAWTAAQRTLSVDAPLQPRSNSAAASTRRSPLVAAVDELDDRSASRLHLLSLCVASVALLVTAAVLSRRIEPDAARAALRLQPNLELRVRHSDNSADAIARHSTSGRRACCYCDACNEAGT